MNDGKSADVVQRPTSVRARPVSCNDDIKQKRAEKVYNRLTLPTRPTFLRLQTKFGPFYYASSYELSVCDITFCVANYAAA